MARKIVVTSGKGGVGKTTILANLGIYLSKQGLKVALIDADFGLNNLDVVMGIEDKIVYDINDVLSGKCRVKQALVQDETRKNLYVLSSMGIRTNSNFTNQNLKVVIENLSGTFDYILIDCPAGIDEGFHKAVSVVDEALLIATPTMSSLRDADKVISILKSYNIANIKIVLNKVRGDLILENKMIDPYSVERLLKTDIIGIIPEEDDVFLSCGYEIPSRSSAGKAIKLLVENVNVGTKKMFDTTKKYSGFFGSIKRSIKNSV